jgi:hypothetical protein
MVNRRVTRNVTAWGKTRDQKNLHLIIYDGEIFDAIKVAA